MNRPEEHPNALLIAASVSMAWVRLQPASLDGQ
jgi:hypothetical protein